MTTPADQPPPGHGPDRDPRRADIERIVARFEDVRPQANGSFKVRCPYHDDRRPSLHISLGKGGRILLHDFGGCRTDDILRAVGLTWADIAPSGPSEEGGTVSLGTPPPRPVLPGGQSVAGRADEAEGGIAATPRPIELQKGETA